MRFVVCLVPVLLVALAVPTVLFADWINTTSEVPLDRLITNLNAILEKRPDDARVHYVLGRVHSMAYAKGGKTLHVESPKAGNGDLPGFAPWETVRQVGKDKPLGPEREKHYRLSIRHYVKATKLVEPAEALYQLGLGWMLEDGSTFSSSLGTPETATLPQSSVPEAERARIEQRIAKLGSETYAERHEAAQALAQDLPRSLPVLLRHRQHEVAEIRLQVGHVLKRHFLDRALAAYRKALAAAAESDAAKKSIGEGGDRAISLEAGKGILRILGARERSPEDEQELDRVRKHVAKIDAIPKWITPIVFPLDRPAAFEACVANEVTVRFDLDGDGIPGRWPWVNARTGILVWDPLRTGVVTSGRQLFGSVTWWMFWRDGYEPLAALDDDGNGWLEGAELDGIAVWRDANGNAISDSGEVQPTAAWSIRRIAVTASESSSAVPGNERGICLADGRTLPTYDWTPRRR